MSTELRRLNHRSYLRFFINANPDMHLKMAVGYVRGMEGANEYIASGYEKLPTNAKFWLSDSIFAHGYRSGFTKYASQETRNDLEMKFINIEHLNTCWGLT